MTNRHIRRLQEIKEKSAEKIMPIKKKKTKTKVKIKKEKIKLEEVKKDEPQETTKMEGFKSDLYSDYREYSGPIDGD